jgi:murein DD-endopeptidase MepM/ murein hydrolase activator NlpD
VAALATVAAVLAALAGIDPADGQQPPPARPAPAPVPPRGPDRPVHPGVYRPPLVAPVIDPFRPPAEPWLPGNRGIEYETVPGSPVHAIGPGLVLFAGSVAGQLHVTVLHPDGIRSSYSFLAAISVAVGDRVVGGQQVGVTGATFHLGARRGSTYIDPASLFGTPVGEASVFLVPLGPGHRVRSGPASAGPAARLAAASVVALHEAGAGAGAVTLGARGGG